MDTPKRLYYKVMLVFVTDFLLAGSSRASKSGKIIMVDDFSLVYSMTGCHKIKVFSHLYQFKSLKTAYGYS